MKKKILLILMSVLSVATYAQVSNERWLGKWTWDDDEHGTEYELYITADAGKTYGELHSSGIYHDYKIKGTVHVQRDRIQLYYNSTIEGKAWGIDLASLDLPLITLKIVEEEILTYWHQDFRDFLDLPLGGTVCFIKED